MARTLAESEGADGFGTFVLVGDKKVVQAFVAECLKEPFTMR